MSEAAEQSSPAGQFDRVANDVFKKFIEDIARLGIPVVLKDQSGVWSTVHTNELDTIPLTAGLPDAPSIYVRKGWLYEVWQSRKKAGENLFTRHLHDAEPEHIGNNHDDVDALIEQFKAMSVSERADYLSDIANTLIQQVDLKEELTEGTAQLIANATSDTNLISRISMFEALARIKAQQLTEAQAKRDMRDIVRATHRIADAVTQILSQSSETQTLFGMLNRASAGNTIAHSNRVFILFISFLLRYNHLIDEGYIAKIRSKFKQQYLPLYKTLSIDSPIERLEDVFEGGLRRIPEDIFLIYATGALIHDLGKIEDLDYFEGSNVRDFEKIKSHVYTSYYLMIKTAEYPHTIPLMAAFHHEYFGHQSGYGLYREFLSMKLRIGERPNTSHLISFDPESVERFRTLAYFPAKALEIVDVYDALTDPLRTYRKKTVLSPGEALGFMRREFIGKKPKIDPILFDIFADYLNHHDPALAFDGRVIDRLRF